MRESLDAPLNVHPAKTQNTKACLFVVIADKKTLYIHIYNFVLHKKHPTYICTCICLSLILGLLVNNVNPRTLLDYLFYLSYNCFFVFCV